MDKFSWVWRSPSQAYHWPPWFRLRRFQLLRTSGQGLGMRGSHIRRDQHDLHAKELTGFTGRHKTRRKVGAAQRE